MSAKKRKIPQQSGSIEMLGAQDVIITNSDIAGDVRIKDARRLAMSGNRHGEAARQHDAALQKSRRPTELEMKTHRWTVWGVVIAAFGVVVAIAIAFLQ